MAAVTTEQQASHTPGPWSVCYDHPDQERRDSIAYIRAPHEREFDLDAEIAVIYGCKDREDRRAAARVMASAPDLLEALQAEEEWRAREAAGALDPEWNYETMVAAKRRAAIAKATGEAS